MKTERTNNSCGDYSLDAHEGFINTLKEQTSDDNRRHPSPEMLLMRQALKYLTPKQKQVWEYYNYDRLSQDQIAVKLSISQQAVQKHIKACEARITRWCRANMGAYELLKHDYRERL